VIDGARVAVVVPAYEEARFIARVVSRVPEFVDLVVVVDDGSRDETAARARVGDRVRVVSHQENRGVGAAIATGYRVAFEAGADVAAVMAGDDQMDPADLEALVREVRTGAAYAKGNRLAWPDAWKAMPLLRFAGNHALSWLTRRMTGLQIHDSQCGYTALARGAWERLGLEDLWPRYGYPNDLLARLAAASLSVREVPVRPVYGDEASGIGWRHALFVIPWVLLRARLRRGAPRRADGRALADERARSALGDERARSALADERGLADERARSRSALADEQARSPRLADERAPRSARLTDEQARPRSRLADEQARPRSGARLADEGAWLRSARRGAEERSRILPGESCESAS